MKYMIEQCTVKAEDIKHEQVWIPDDAILQNHFIVIPDRYIHESDPIHIITWLRPVKEHV